MIDGGYHLVGIRKEEKGPKEGGESMMPIYDGRGG